MRKKLVTETSKLAVRKQNVNYDNWCKPVTFCYLVQTN